MSSPHTQNYFTALLDFVRDYLVSRHQKGKTNLDLLKQESEWQWHQLGHMHSYLSHNGYGIIVSCH